MGFIKGPRTSVPAITPRSGGGSSGAGGWDAGRAKGVARYRERDSCLLRVDMLRPRCPAQQSQPSAAKPAVLRWHAMRAAGLSTCSLALCRNIESARTVANASRRLLLFRVVYRSVCGRGATGDRGARPAENTPPVVVCVM